MRRVVLISVGAVSWAATLALAAFLGFETGGRVGFEEATLLTKFREDAVNGRFIAEILRDLRAKNDQEAISQLEGMLDGAALTYDAFSELDLRRFERPLNSADYERIYFLGVGRYRMDYPSEFSNPDARRSIERAVAKLVRRQNQTDRENPLPPHNKRMQPDEP